MKLLFLSYINRSGSTFLAELLSKYEDIFIFPEGDAIVDEFLINEKIKPKQYLSQLSQLFIRDLKLTNYSFSEADIQKVCQKQTKEKIFWEILNLFKEKHKSNASILIFKKRDAFSKFQKISTILENLNPELICLWRDPRSIFHSQKNSINPYSGKPFNTNPLITAYYWNFYMDFMKKKKCLKIQFETLIDNPQLTLSKLIQEMGLNNINQQSQITYFDILPKEQKKLHMGIKQPPKKNYIDKWKNGLKNIEKDLIEKICQNHMKEFHYHSSAIEKKSITSLFYLLYYKIRIFLKLDTY